MKTKSKTRTIGSPVSKRDVSSTRNLISKDGSQTNMLDPQDRDRLLRNSSCESVLRSKISQRDRSRKRSSRGYPTVFHSISQERLRNVSQRLGATPKIIDK